MFYKCFSYLDIHVPRFGEFSAVVLLKWFSVPLACHFSSSGMPVIGIVHCFRVARGSCLFSPWFSTSLLFFLWDSSSPEDLPSSPAGFSSAWSDLLLRLTFFFNFSVENCSPGGMGSFLWQPSCDFLLMMCFGGISPRFDSQHEVGCSFLSQSLRLFSTVFLPHMIPRRLQG